ncbi:MAG: aspartate aminotransferase family protein [Pirellulales bacterium]|nr:aspartate aminotransferase family protein [Pirellulales bacterium]
MTSQSDSSRELLPLLLRTDAELEMGGHVLSELESLCRIKTAPSDAEEVLIREAADAELIYTCYAPITGKVIEAAPALRGIVKYGVGVDSIDLEAAARRGIPVVHAPDYGTETVADQAFALLISLARQMPRIDRDLKSAGWLWPETKYQGVDLAGKTIGIVGYGRIGRAMARRASGFGMRRLIHDPHVRAPEHQEELEFVSLERLIEQADFLSLHCVLTDQTREMIGVAELEKMKSTAILVNVSRGPLIDERALVAALEQGEIAGAGLDVFAREPLTDDHPLLKMDQVVLSPHFAFYSREAYERLEADCLEKIRLLTKGTLPRDVKNADLLAKAAGQSPQAADVATRTGYQPDVSEGDINTSPHRDAWQQQTGEANRQLLARDAQAFVHQALSTPCLSGLVATDGVYLEDLDGRRYFDFHGNSAHQIGYGHPHVKAAVQKQLDQLPFCPRRYTNETAVRLAEKLIKIAPAGLSRVLFAPGGAEAVGMAMKLARYATGRHKTVSMWDAFHGATLETISIGGEAHFRDGLGPLLPGALHVPWPHAVEDAGAIERLLCEQGDIGAVIAEPIRCTTLEMPPAAYWQAVRKLCDQYGVLLIFDEIPIALGRTGSWFYCEQLEVVPDMLVLGKGLGGSFFPLAAVLVREELADVSQRSVGHYTHEKSPLAAAAGLATLEVIEQENLLAASDALGRQLREQLQQLASSEPIIHQVRGVGLAVAVEIATDGAGSSDAAERIMFECLRRGLSFKVSAGRVLTLTPPLTISAEQLGEALAILKQSIVVVARQLSSETPQSPLRETEPIA